MRKRDKEKKRTSEPRKRNDDNSIRIKLNYEREEKKYSRILKNDVNWKRTKRDGKYAAQENEQGIFNS